MVDSSNYWLRRRVSRRTTLRGGATVGLGAAALGLVGCGDDDAAPTGGGGKTGLLPTAGITPTIAAKQPKPGGSFSFQIGNAPPGLDPFTQTSFIGSYMNSLSYSNITGLPNGVAMRSLGGVALDTITSGTDPVPIAISPTNSGSGWRRQNGA